MVDKVSKQGRSYTIDGRRLVWHPEDDDGEQGSVPDITIPLRIKMNTVLELAERELDTVGMKAMLEAILPPAATAVFGDMDVNDFQDMFVTWQAEYNALTGGSLGESSTSAASSPSTAGPSSTTSGPASPASPA